MSQADSLAPEGRILAALASFRAPVRAAVLRDKVATDGNGVIPIGVLYVALDRLERQGCVLVSIDPINQTKHLFEITRDGASLLRDSNDAAAAFPAGSLDFVAQMLDLLDLERPKGVDVAAAKASLQAVLRALEGRRGKGDQE